jgi:hypothetical protein
MASFGIESAAANIALLALSLAQVAVAYWLLARLFVRLGFAPQGIGWGLVLLCFIPLYIEREMVDFRYWEGALVLGLAAATLALLANIADHRRFPLRLMMAAAALCALTTFTSPPAGLAVSACWGWWALRQLPLHLSFRFALIGIGALAIVITPWAMRNQQALGAPVLLRSNSGLELALANHSGALSDRPPSQVFDERMDQIHPYRDGPARSAMAAAGGEAAYSARLGAGARAWISTHPIEFAQLSLRHLRQLYFPPPWLFDLTESDGRSTARALAIGLVNLIGLVSLGFGVIRKRRGYALLALYLFCLTLPYMLVQPTPRYTFQFYTPLLFVAIDGLVSLTRLLPGRRKAEICQSANLAAAASDGV